MDRRQSPGVRDVSHPHAVSRNAAFSADGVARPHPAPRLDALRHWPRRFSAQAHDARRTRTRLCLDLPAPVLARLHLAAPSAAGPGCAAVSRHVLSLQALEPFLAPADQARLGERRLEAAGRSDALAARALSPPVGATGD